VSSRIIALGTVLAALAAIACAPVIGGEPSFHHRYLMKGNILAIEDGEVYLCVGTHDGAVAGQVLDVVRVRRAGVRGLKGSGMRFKREHVGKVRIVEVVDEHFARAERVEGELRESDLVELEAPRPQTTETP
jgi:hypothetical protein